MLWIDPHCRRYCILCLVQWRRHRGVQTVHWIWARAPGGPEWGHKKCMKWHTYTVHTGFSIVGEIIWEHKKYQNPWRLVELTPLPRPGSRSSPKPHPRSQHFGLPASALGAEATEGPPSHCWIMVPQSLATPLALWQCDTDCCTVCNCLACSSLSTAGTRVKMFWD